MSDGAEGWVGMAACHHVSYLGAGSRRGGETSPTLGTVQKYRQEAEGRAVAALPQPRGQLMLIKYDPLIVTFQI